MFVVLIAAFLFGFVFYGFGGGSSGVGNTTRHYAPHHVNCKARMSSGESRRDCGGPPANP